MVLLLVAASARAQLAGDLRTVIARLPAPVDGLLDTPGAGSPFRMLGARDGVEAALRRTTGPAVRVFEGAGDAARGSLGAEYVDDAATTLMRRRLATTTAYLEWAVPTAAPVVAGTVLRFGRLWAPDGAETLVPASPAGGLASWTHGSSTATGGVVLDWSNRPRALVNGTTLVGDHGWLTVAAAEGAGSTQTFSSFTWSASERLGFRATYAGDRRTGSAGISGLRQAFALESAWGGSRSWTLLRAQWIAGGGRGPSGAGRRGALGLSAVSGVSLAPGWDARLEFRFGGNATDERPGSTVAASFVGAQVVRRFE